MANTYKQAIRAFYDAGCRYLQFDDTAWAYLCSQAELKKARERGLNAERLAQDYAGIINKALEGKPADMVVTTHICRGNFRSTWISEGGYEPVAEVLLAQLNYDGYFLEYDTERAGGFEPLRFLPKGDKIVVLGLVTTKSGQLEKKDDVKRRIEEATKLPRSISWRCHRNAVLPRPKKATNWPRKSNGRSSAWWSSLPMKCGASLARAEINFASLWPGIAVRRTASLCSPMSRPSRLGGLSASMIGMRGSSPRMTTERSASNPRRSRPTLTRPSAPAPRAG